MNTRFTSSGINSGFLKVILKLLWENRVLVIRFILWIIGHFNR